MTITAVDFGQAVGYTLGGGKSNQIKSNQIINFCAQISGVVSQVRERLGDDVMVSCLLCMCSTVTAVSVEEKK